jgi:hypothetical protein
VRIPGSEGGRLGSGSLGQREEGCSRSGQCGCLTNRASCGAPSRHGTGGPWGLTAGGQVDFLHS